MSSSKDTLALPSHARWVQFQFHQLVHILQSEHVAIKLYHSVILGQTERCKFRPTIVEARVVAIVDMDFGHQIRDVLGWYATSSERIKTILWKGVGVECDEGVFGIVLL